MSAGSPFTSSQSLFERTMSASPSDTRSRRRCPQTLPSSPSRPSSFVLVEPKSEYLRDILRDTSARHDLARSMPRRPESPSRPPSGPEGTVSYIDSWVAAIEDDGTNNVQRPTRPKPRRASSVATGASGSMGKGAQGTHKGLTTKEMDALLDKQSKENFDLKLRICLQEEKITKLGKELEETQELVEQTRNVREEAGLLRQEQAEAQQRIEALSTENEMLRRENDENVAIYEDVLKELEKRDAALYEAGDIITELQHRLTHLETAYETLRSTVAPIHMHDSAYASAAPSVTQPFSSRDHKGVMHVRSRDDLDLPKYSRPPTSYDSDYFSASTSPPRTEPHTPRSQRRAVGIPPLRYARPARKSGIPATTGSHESIHSTASDGRTKRRGGERAASYGAQLPVRPLSCSVRTGSPGVASGALASFAERQRVAGIMPSPLLSEGASSFHPNEDESNSATPTPELAAHSYSARLEKIYAQDSGIPATAKYESGIHHPALRAIYLTHTSDTLAQPSSTSHRKLDDAHPALSSTSPTDPVFSRPSHPPPGLKFGEDDPPFDANLSALPDVAAAASISTVSLDRYSEGDARTEITATDVETEVDLDLGNHGLRRYPEWPGMSMAVGAAGPRRRPRIGVGADRRRSVSDMGRRVAVRADVNGQRDVVNVAVDETPAADVPVGNGDEKPCPTKEIAVRESRRESLSRLLEPPAGFLSFAKFGRKG